VISIVINIRKRKGRRAGFFSYITAVLFFFAKSKKRNVRTGTCFLRSLPINQSSVIIEEKKTAYNQLQNR
jgi:hypothetical protein